MTSFDLNEPLSPDDMEHSNAGLYVLGGLSIIVVLVWVLSASM